MLRTQGFETRSIRADLYAARDHNDHGVDRNLWARRRVASPQSSIQHRRLVSRPWRPTSTFGSGSPLEQKTKPFGRGNLATCSPSEAGLVNNVPFLRMSTRLSSSVASVPPGPRPERMTTCASKTSNSADGAPIASNFSARAGKMVNAPACVLQGAGAACETSRSGRPAGGTALPDRRSPHARTLEEVRLSTPPSLWNHPKPVRRRSVCLRRYGKA